MDESLIRDVIESALSGLGDAVVADARLLGGESALLRIKAGRAVEHSTHSDLRVELRAAAQPATTITCSTTALDDDGGAALAERAKAALSNPSFAPSDADPPGLRWLAAPLDPALSPRRANFDDNLLDSGPAYRVDLVADALLAIEDRGWICDATVAHVLDGAELDGPSACAAIANTRGHFVLERSSWARSVIDIRARPDDPRLLWRHVAEGYSRSKAYAELDTAVLDRLEPLVKRVGTESATTLDTVPLTWVLSEWATATLWRVLSPLFISGTLGLIERNIGETLTFKGLDVKLDPADPNVRGRSFDALGTLTLAVPLIEDGVAVGLLHEHGRMEQMGREPRGYVVDANTGRVQPRDWVVSGGVEEQTLWDLLVDVEDGLCWIDLQAQLRGETLFLSAPRGVWTVQKGSLQRLVYIPEVRVEVAALLGGIDAVGRSHCVLGGMFPSTLLTLPERPELAG